MTNKAPARRAVFLTASVLKMGEDCLVQAVLAYTLPALKEVAFMALCTEREEAESLATLIHAEAQQILLYLGVDYPDSPFADDPRRVIRALPRL